MTWYILGAGVSGVGAAQLLKSRGEEIHFFSKHPLSNTSKLKELDAECSPEPDQLPDDAEGLILSPSAPIDHPLRQNALHRKLPALSEIDLALENYQGPIITVTGTNGKSSTVDMLAHILQHDFHAPAVGNIGVSPCELLARGDTPDVMIIELSSYQIELSKPIASDIAIWTTFSEDHLARHKTLSAYFEAKAKLLRSAKNHVIIGPSVPTDTLGLPAHIQVHTPPPSPGFQETHNQMNAAWALEAARLWAQKNYQWDSHLQDYQALPHRFQRLKSPAQHVINDSKSTNLESTLEALKSCHEPTEIWIGGMDKHEDFSPLLSVQNISRFIIFGAAQGRLSAQLASTTTSRISSYKTLKQALQNESCKQPTLFSPGCASQDEFKSFEARGDFFCEQVYKTLKGLKTCTSHKPKSP